MESAPTHNRKPVFAKFATGGWMFGDFLQHVENVFAMDGSYLKRTLDFAHYLNQL